MLQIAPYLSATLFVLGLLSGITPLMLFIAIRGLIDTHFKLSAQGSVQFDDMAPWFALVISVAVIEAVVVLSKKKVASELAARADREVTTRVLTQANLLEISYFDSRRNQEEISRLQGHISGRLVSVVEKSADAFSGLVQGVTLTAILVVIEPLVLPVVAPLFIPYIFFQLNLAQHKLSHARYLSESHRRIGYYVNMLSGGRNIAEVRLLGIGAHMVERFKQTMDRIRNDQRNQENIDFVGSTVFAVLSIAALFYVFSLVIESTLANQSSMGDLVVFAAAMIRLRKTLEQLASVMSLCVEQLGHVSDLRNFLKRMPRSFKSEAAKLKEFDGSVQIENLNFRYPETEALVLDGLSLSIQPGQTVALVGENGCGKSTLVKLIAGFYSDYEGSIALSKQDLGGLDVASVQRNISFVFQDFARYSATAAENLAYGDWQRLQHDRNAVEDLAKSLNLHAAIREMPEGYNTMLGRSFGDYEPSGGIWQRIAIARAFASSAPLLILDEPTANVDVRTEYELFSQLKDLARDKTTILISHRFSTVSMADCIFVMRKGRIVEQGSHAQLLAQDGYYAELHQYYLTRMHFGG